MKFKRNQKDRRLFIILSIISAFLTVLGIGWNIINYNKQIFNITILLGLLSIIGIIITIQSKEDYVEFRGKIIFITSSSSKFTINLNDLKKIFIPTKKALNKKMFANNIIFNCEYRKYSTSYSQDIEQYIKENFSNLIEYYDSYVKVINL